jgi:hypothetical protein
MVVTFGWIYGTSAPNQVDGRSNDLDNVHVRRSHNLVKPNALYPSPCFIHPVVKGVFIPDINRHNAKHGVELLGAVIMPVGRLGPSIYILSMSQNAFHPNICFPLATQHNLYLHSALVLSRKLDRAQKVSRK